MRNQFEKLEDNQKKDNSAKKEGVSYEEVLDNMKSVVARRVSEIYGLSEDELVSQHKEFYDQCVRYLAVSSMISLEAGDSFSKMIPRSLRKPKNGFDRDYQLPSFFEIEKFRKEKFSEFQKMVNFSDITKDFRSEVYEQKDEDAISQIAYNRFLRDDGENVLEELINNYLRTDFNSAVSILAVTNRKTGTRIDLEQMLPDGYYFSPEEMIKIEQKFDQETESKKTIIHPVDMKDYKGSKSSSGGFYNSPELKKVAYGDLSKTGGLLSLFHEIAHAWQNVYHGENNRHNFENFYNEVSNLLKILKSKQDGFKNGDITKDKYDYFVECVRKSLKKVGVEFDADNFIYQGQELEKGSIIIADFESVRYVFRCENFESIKQGFEKEERDAWAHALLMVRFLRRMGIDLEPGMKNISDLRRYIAPYLESYQKGVEERMEIIGGKINFIKKSNK